MYPLTGKLSPDSLVARRLINSLSTRTVVHSDAVDRDAHQPKGSASSDVSHIRISWWCFLQETVLR